MGSNLMVKKERSFTGVCAGERSHAIFFFQMVLSAGLRR